MTTKDQERKALEQIKKIVAGLGENSYIGMAMEGVLEDAEENIENDFGLSMNGRWQAAEQKLEKTKAELILAKQTMQQESARANNLAKQITAKNGRIDELLEQVQEYKNNGLEQWNARREFEDKLEAVELENMKLKAKLYDMMMANGAA